MNLKKWYRMPIPDDFRSLSKFLTEEEKAFLRKMKRQIRTFELMNSEEYEKLQRELEEYIFSIIEDFIRDEDRDAIKEKVQEEISEYNVIDLTTLKLKSIAKRVYAEYNNISCPMDDTRAYELDKEFCEFLRAFGGDL